MSDLKLQLFLIGSFFILGTAAKGETINAVEDFHIKADGNIITNTLKQMNTNEFVYMYRVACMYGGEDCADQAQNTRDAAEYARELSQSEDHFITGEITIHDEGSEEWYGMFNAPDGFTPCRAAIDTQHLGISDGSTFNATLFRHVYSERIGRELNGVGFYAVVPWSSHNENLDAHIVITYVLDGQGDNAPCFANQTVLWTMKGADINVVNGARVLLPN